ncbi:MAG: hypothetical protein ACO3M5_02030 [Saprospiraceae bacterium]
MIRRALKGKPLDSSHSTSMVFQHFLRLPWHTVLDNGALALKFQGAGKEEREACHGNDSFSRTIRA